MKRLKENEAEHPEENWEAKLDIHRDVQQGKLAAVLDTSAGLTYADKVSSRTDTGHA